MLKTDNIAAIELFNALYIKTYFPNKTSSTKSNLQTAKIEKKNNTSIISKTRIMITVAKNF